MYLIGLSMLLHGSLNAQLASVTPIETVENQSQQSYIYSFRIQDINAASPDGDVKTILTICEPIFEGHPQFKDDKFIIQVDFKLSTERITSLFFENGFEILEISERTLSASTTNTEVE